MSLYRNFFRKATGPIAPPGFDPKEYPILAAHWFGIVPHALDPRVIRILGADRFPTTPVHEVCR